MKRERPRCDCGKELTHRDFVQGVCPRCGNYLDNPADWDDTQ